MRTSSNASPTRRSASDTAFLRLETSASFPLSVALSEDISERKPDFNDSSSRGVIVGMDRGVGAAGISKSKRLIFAGDLIDSLGFFKGDRRE